MLAIVTKYAFEAFSLDDWEEDHKEEFRQALKGAEGAAWPAYYLDSYVSNMDGLTELAVIDDDGKVIYNGEL